MRPATAVVFDLGQVLVPAWDLRPLAESVGADAAAFAAAYWAHRVGYDCGLPPAGYWGGVLADCLPGGTLDPDDVDRLTREDAERWIQVAPQARTLLEDLRAAGVPLGLLSNAPVPLALAARQADWAGLFDVLVFSGEIGVAKPEPAIYHAVRDLLGRPAGEDPVFFDDRPANVDGARAVGWTAHLWTGVQDARGALAPLLNRSR